MVAKQEQEAWDEAVVRQTQEEIRAYQEDPDSGWEGYFQEAEEVIDGLYNHYAPELSAAQRALGREIGATGLAFLSIKYGPDEYAPRQYSGTYEEGVPATYHPARHSYGFMGNKFLYMRDVNEQYGLGVVYDELDFANAPVDAVLHDAIMGNGRGNDERQSALLAAHLMRERGASEESVRRSVAGIDATTWDDEISAQSVRETDPYLWNRRAAAVADMKAGVFDPRAVYEGQALFVEDYSKQREKRLFVVQAGLHGFEVEGKTVDDYMEFVDWCEPLRQAYGRHASNQGIFCRTFQPADPHLDELYPGRTANAEWYEDAAAEFHGGSMGAHDILLAARERAQTA